MTGFIHLLYDDLDVVTGGAKLSLKPPGAARDRFLAQCGPQIDAYTRAREDLDAHRSDTRKEVDAITAGRTLALCATNAGFDPPPQWRYTNTRR
jgi:hypothetical protein